jgi:hypothetical protein
MSKRRRITFGTIRYFLREYIRKHMNTPDPNDRPYNRKPEQHIKQLEPIERYRLIRDDNGDETSTPMYATIDRPSAWEPFEQGATRGTLGSENGIILRDEEYEKNARITLEQDGSIAPFSITCGIYGWMVHTCFFSRFDEAVAAYWAMQEEIRHIVDSIPRHDDPDNSQNDDDTVEAITAFVNRYA